MKSLTPVWYLYLSQENKEGKVLSFGRVETPIFLIDTRYNNVPALKVLAARRMYTVNVNLTTIIKEGIDL